MFAVRIKLRRESSALAYWRIVHLASELAFFYYFGVAVAVCEVDFYRRRTAEWKEREKERSRLIVASNGEFGQIVSHQLELIFAR